MRNVKYFSTKIQDILRPQGRVGPNLRPFQHLENTKSKIRLFKTLQEPCKLLMLLQLISNHFDCNFNKSYTTTKKFPG